jgi:hypothetical protein
MARPVDKPSTVHRQPAPQAIEADPQPVRLRLSSERPEQFEGVAQVIGDGQRRLPRGDAVRRLTTHSSRG